MQPTCNYWYPMVSHLCRFFIVVSRNVVHDDGKRGIVLDPEVWSSGAAINKARTESTVREFAWFPGLTGVWLRDWQSWTDFHVSLLGL